MRLLVYIALCVTVPLSGVSQNNLVPNPSFEANVGCPNAAGKIWLAEPWDFVLGSVDYFHACGTNGWTVPENTRGFQHASDGDGYAGIGVWSMITPEFREFLGVPLNEPLESGIKYEVGMKISLNDTVYYTVQLLGAYFSQGQPSSSGGAASFFNLSPQVEFQDSGFFEDSGNWTELSGNFIASGGENFMTIGNFLNDSDTDTLYVGPTQGGQSNLSSSGYYVDAVYVVEDTSIQVASTEAAAPSFTLYPNPASGQLVVDVSSQHQGMLVMYDPSGRVVLSQSVVSNRETLDVSNLKGGIYTVVIETDEAVLRKRVVVED